MQLPESWQEKDEDVGPDATVIAFDLSQNTVISFVEYGTPIFKDLPLEENAMGPQFVLDFVHPDDHDELIRALEEVSHMGSAETHTYRLRLKVNDHFEPMTIRSTPLLTDRLGNTYVVRSVVFVEGSRNEP
ncbi:MAG TPA: hypothetical protein VGE01_02740 [Fimbriimonas sp.]